MARGLDAYVDGVPGSVYLVDVLQKSNLHDEAHKEIVLNPVPSLDANDPLNWTRGRKIMSGMCSLIYTFTLGFGSSTYFSIYTGLIRDRGLTLADLTEGTGLLFGFYGWGGLLVIPLAIVWSTRSVYISSLLIAAVGVTFWTPHIWSGGAWKASRIVYGIFGAPVESLPEIAIAQVFFTHERGIWIGAYSFVVFGCSFLAPVFSGFVYDGVGLEWTMYFTALVGVAGAVFMFFFAEETNYRRVTTAVEAVAAPASQGSQEDLEKKEAVSAKPTDIAEVDLHNQLVGTPYSFVRKRVPAH